MNNLILINADTDSLMVSKPDGSPWTKEEQSRFLESLNSQFPEKIRFEHDGVFKRVVVIKSKNYALLPEDSNKVKLKGSSIKDQKKEPALKEMMEKIVKALIDDKKDIIIHIYHEYVKEALNVIDIKRWAQKKSLTESILKCKNWTQEQIHTKELRKNETDIWDSIKDEEGLQQGDKFYVYPVVEYKTITGRVSQKTGKPLKDMIEEINSLKLTKYWKNDHSPEKLIQRIYDTLCIFESVLDMSHYIDYSKTNNKKLLEKFK